MTTTTKLPILGKVLTKIKVIDNEIIYFFTDEEVYKMYHNQDCCESVVIDDICGDLDDLLYSPLVVAEETVKNGDVGDSSTWTFYRLMAADKLPVVIKWLGQSNGYYSESVYLERLSEQDAEAVRWSVGP